MMKTPIKKTKRIRIKLGENKIAELNYENEIKAEDPSKPDYPFEDLTNINSPDQPNEIDKDDKEKEKTNKHYGI